MGTLPLLTSVYAGASAGGKDTSTPSQKRTGVMSWDEYFMSVAFLCSQRSKDPRTQVGACIVNNNNRIVGTGYNGMPNDCSDDKIPWGIDGDDPLKTKRLYVCHAELNAVMNKFQADIRGCRMYVTLFPCNECAKIIIQSGIKKVIYYSDKYGERKEFKATRILFDRTDVKYRQYDQSAKTSININFEDINKHSN